MRIKSIQLFDDSTLAVSDFTVIVGGNGVGKSTLLREVFHKAASRSLAKYRWVKALEYDTHAPRQCAQLLLDSLSMQYEEGNPSHKRYRSRALKRYEGLLDTDALFEADLFQLLSNLASGEGDLNQLITHTTLRAPFFASHSCDHRLNVPNRMPLNSIDTPPQDALNVLWRHPTLRRDVSAAIHKRFGINLVLLDHRGSELELGISQQTPPYAPAGEFDRQKHFVDVEAWKEQHWSSITEAGHGIRAMTNLLLSVFEPVNKVLVIDEPELHLYPAQKRALGSTLVALAKNEGKQVILVTHDASFLQGVLDSGGDATILRLCNDVDRRNRKVLPCELTKSESLPVTTKQREYLNALFHEYVVVVEGASDRAFYQGCADLYEIDDPNDVGFVVGGGKGAFVNISFLCSRVGVPSAFVCDFDMILGDQLGILAKVLGTRGTTLPSQIERLSAQALREVQSHLGTSTPQRAYNCLKESGLKTDGLTEPSRTGLQSCFDHLEQAGVFVVRDGALESWAKSIDSKARFAEQALADYELQKDSGRSVEAFLRRVFKYLGNNAGAA